MNRNGVFISYSKKDAKWLEGLRTHLTFLEREYEFNIWDDSKIAVGDDWRKEINTALSSAKIGVLLMSANFIASDFITNEELPVLLSAAEEEGAYIFSIIVSHSMFLDIESVSKFQTINPPSKPLITMTDGELDETYMKVTQEIKRVLSEPSKNSKNNINIDYATGILWKSFLRVRLIELLFEKQGGLSISQLCNELKIKKRKNGIEILHELEELKIIDKTKTNTLTKYYLSAIGEEFVANHKKEQS